MSNKLFLLKTENLLKSKFKYLYPFYTQKNVVYINLDFFKFNKSNKDLLKTFFYGLIKNNNYVLFGKYSIKNILLIIELFPNVDIIEE